MIWYVLIGLFAAFGVLSALWVTLGAWLTGGIRCTVAVRCPPGRAAAVIRRWRYLRQLGLARGKLVLICAQPTQQERRMAREQGIGMMTPEEYLRRLEQERESVDGT